MICLTNARKCSKSIIIILCFFSSFSFPHSSGTQVSEFWPDWIQGRVVVETGTRPGFSTVLVNLPVLTSDERAEYDTFEVAWRRLGSEIWESTTTSSRSTNVTLPGELADGSYEVRVQAQGFGGASLYNNATSISLEE